MTSSPYVHFSHANVQRGLAAAPFAIPAPGRKSPLRGSRSKTLRADVFFNPVTVGRVSAAHPPPGFRSRVEGKQATPVTSFRSPCHHPDLFWFSQNPGRSGENPPRLPPIKKGGCAALTHPTSNVRPNNKRGVMANGTIPPPRHSKPGSLACVTTPRWRRRSRGGLSATARPG